MTDSLAAEFERLGPWVTGFVIDGHSYGGAYDAAQDAFGRIGHFTESFPDAASILELGSLEGGHTVCLAKLPGVRRVVAIEGRQENIDRARFVARLLGVNNVSFEFADLEQFDLATLGSFDAVFNCGLLYHLPEPWKLLTRIARVSDRMFLSTHYCRDQAVTISAGGYMGSWYTELGRDDMLSGLALRSFWPSRAELLRMILDAGFGHVDVRSEDTEHPHGPLIGLAMSK